MNFAPSGSAGGAGGWALPGFPPCGVPAGGCAPGCEAAGTLEAMSSMRLRNLTSASDCVWATFLITLDSSSGTISRTICFTLSSCRACSSALVGGGTKGLSRPSPKEGALSRRAPVAATAAITVLDLISFPRSKKARGAPLLLSGQQFCPTVKDSRGVVALDPCECLIDDSPWRRHDKD